MARLGLKKLFTLIDKNYQKIDVFQVKGSIMVQHYCYLIESWFCSKSRLINVKLSSLSHRAMPQFGDIVYLQCYRGSDRIEEKLKPNFP